MSLFRPYPPLIRARHPSRPGQNSGAIRQRIDLRLPALTE